MPVGHFLLRSSPAQMLEGAGPELDALLSSSARARLLRGAEALALPARTVCFECRLAEHDDRVDLALCLATPTANLAAALDALGGKYVTDPRWQRCIQFLVRWANGEETRLADVPFLFTAFDLATDVSEMPVPCLSLCADPSFFMRRVGLPAARAARDWPLRLLDICRAGLGLDWLTAQLRENARRCVEAVEDCEVRQLSLMLAREPPTLKLDLTLPAGELGHFLALNGWGGCAAAVSEQLSSFAPWQRRIQLNYTLNPLNAPAPLELELCCTGPDEPDDAARSTLLQRLVSSGLASAGKASALLELLREPTIVDAEGRWAARNWYLKLRFDGGRFDLAKAYIGLMQRSTGNGLGANERAPLATSR